MDLQPGGIGRHNQVEIFLNSVEKCRRSSKIYADSDHGQDLMHTIFEQSRGALERALERDDEILLMIKANEIIFERKIVYSNNNKKTSLSIPLYDSGIRYVRFIRGLLPDEIEKFIESMAVDLSDPSMMDMDLYCLLNEYHFEHIFITGIDLLAEAEKRDPELRQNILDFRQQAIQKEKPLEGSRQRRLRSDDLKILEEFKLNPLTFKKSDEEVSRIIQTLHASHEGEKREKETLEKLALMAFHLLINEQEVEQKLVGQNLMIQVAEMILESKRLRLFGALLKKIYQVQKENPNDVGQYQKILDSVFHPEQIELFKPYFKGKDLRPLMLQILQSAPSSAVRVMVLLLEDYPDLVHEFKVNILKDLGGFTTWLDGEVLKRPENAAWEPLINIMAQKPNQQFQHFLKQLLSTPKEAIHAKVYKQLAKIGTVDTLRIFDSKLKSQDEKERRKIYDYIALAKNKNALLLLKNHLESDDFAYFSEDEKIHAYSCLLQVAGESCLPWFEVLWMKPAEGIFKSKNLNERRTLMIKAFAKGHATLISRLLQLTPMEQLSEDLQNMINKIRDSKK